MMVVYVAAWIAWALFAFDLSHAQHVGAVPALILTGGVVLLATAPRIASIVDAWRACMRRPLPSARIVRSR
jgi:hypothetical protein